LKGKLIRLLFLKLETSYLTTQSEFYTTKSLLQLLKILADNQVKTFDILMKSRAKHLREMT
jgi:hypothetical protein